MSWRSATADRLFRRRGSRRRSFSIDGRFVVRLLFLFQGLLVFLLLQLLLLLSYFLEDLGIFRVIVESLFLAQAVDADLMVTKLAHHEDHLLHVEAWSRKFLVIVEVIRGYRDPGRDVQRARGTGCAEIHQNV